MTETVVNINKSPRQDIDRKIAVIFVTDVVGFSKSMERNEDETLRSFRSCRDILDNLFEELVPKRLKGTPKARLFIIRS